MAAEFHRYVDTVQRLADWGKEAQTKDDAARDMLKTMDVAGAALLEILQKLRRFGEACRKDDRDGPERLVRPQNIKAFPGTAVGDSLWTFDLEEGLTRYLITAVEGEFVQVVTAGPTKYAESWICWGFSGLFASKAEAMKNSCEDEVDYHSPRLDVARQILAAIEAGGPLTEFEDGHEFD